MIVNLDLGTRNPYTFGFTRDGLVSFNVGTPAHPVFPNASDTPGDHLYGPEHTTSGVLCELCTADGDPVFHATFAHCHDCLAAREYGEWTYQSELPARRMGLL